MEPPLLPPCTPSSLPETHTVLQTDVRYCDGTALHPPPSPVIKMLVACCSAAAAVTCNPPPPSHTRGGMLPQPPPALLHTPLNVPVQHRSPRRRVHRKQPMCHSGHVRGVEGGGVLMGLRPTAPLHQPAAEQGGVQRQISRGRGSLLRCIALASPTHPHSRNRQARRGCHNCSSA